MNARDKSIKRLWQLPAKNKIFSDFYVLDTETGTRKDNPDGTVTITWEKRAQPSAFIFGVIYGHNYSKTIHNLKEFNETLLEPRFKNKIVFAHNMGRYDILVMYGNPFELDANSIFIGSRFIRCTNGNCIFADSLNILKAKVSEIGAMMNKEKIGMADGSYTASLWPRDKARDENACVRDCEIVYDALLDFFEYCNGIKITIGSLAMNYYRTYHQPFIIEHNPELTKYFWASYYGGRTEMIKQGATFSKVIDVNSMYPAVMIQERYPNPKFLKHENNIDTNHFINSVLPFNEGCGNFEIVHPEIFIGLLPTRINGKLCFPVGNLKGCWNFTEIRFALENGCTITKVNDITYAEPMPTIFESFVKTLYEGKFKGASELEIWKYKYLMNNLYGKFGQRINEETIYIANTIEQWEVIERYQKEDRVVKLIMFNAERLDAFLVIKKESITLAHSIPSFASYITSAGRIMTARKLLEMEKNIPTYCDTDSIFFEIDNGVPSSGILGEWKIEDKVVTQINGLKNYRYKTYDQIKKLWIDKRRVKGVPLSAIEIAPFEFEFENLMGTKESLRRGMEAGLITKRKKTVRNVYDKRILESNGNTKPIKL